MYRKVQQYTNISYGEAKATEFIGFLIRKGRNSVFFFGLLWSLSLVKSPSPCLAMKLTGTVMFLETEKDWKQFLSYMAKQSLECFLGYEVVCI